MTNITFNGKWEGSSATFECTHGLIQALLVFFKYDNQFNVIGDKGKLIVDVRPSYISDEDTAFLAERGFYAEESVFRSDERWIGC